MNKWWLQLFCGCLFVVAPMLWAHEPMSHQCQAPLRPANDQDDRLWQQFLDQINGFRSCVNIFKERHQVEAKQHDAAARAAVDAWNVFVRTSLNAPEDFPWPPER